MASGIAIAPPAIDRSEARRRHMPEKLPHLYERVRGSSSRRPTKTSLLRVIVRSRTALPKTRNASEIQLASRNIHLRGRGIA